MKKVLFMLMLSLSIGFIAKAQDEKDKVKPTSTAGQKVHNTLSKHKHYKGYKAKHKANGHTKKHKVDNKSGEVKNKAK